MKTLSSLTDKVVRSTRSSESPIETTLFHAMMRSGKLVLCREDDKPVGEGLFLFPQKQVGNYRADFVINANCYLKGTRVWPPKLQATVAVECDGNDFHTSPEQVEYDKQRDEYFLANGITTLRFTGSEISRNAGFCVEQILHEIGMLAKAS